MVNVIKVSPLINSASAVALTLPTISSAGYNGVYYKITNAGAGTVTITYAGSQYFNNQSGTTTITLATGKCCHISAIWNSTGYWAIWSNTGTLT